MLEREAIYVHDIQLIEPFLTSVISAKAAFLFLEIHWKITDNLRESRHCKTKSSLKYIFLLLFKFKINKRIKESLLLLSQQRRANLTNTSAVWLQVLDPSLILKSCFDNNIHYRTEVIQNNYVSPSTNCTIRNESDSTISKDKQISLATC